MEQHAGIQHTIPTYFLCPEDSKSKRCGGPGGGMVKNTKIIIINLVEIYGKNK
jgi:hypothetical protein